MAERQLRVMISGTTHGLSAYIKAVVEACTSLDLSPMRLEGVAANEGQVPLIAQNAVDQADIYVGIFGHRYGYIPQENNPSQISLVEMEYNRAVERGVPCLIFLMSTENPVTSSEVETREARAKFEQLKNRLRERHIVTLFTSPQSLRSYAINSLSETKAFLEKRRAEGDQHFHPENTLDLSQKGHSHDVPTKARQTRKKEEKDAVRTERVAGVRVLRRGMSGDDVTNWQQFLLSQNLDVETDGSFGPGTYQATIDFQATNGLPTDGMVGPATRAKADEVRAMSSPNNPAESVSTVEEAEPEVAGETPGERVYNDETSAEAGEMAQIQAEMDEERAAEEEEEPVSVHDVFKDIPIPSAKSPRRPRAKRPSEEPQSTSSVTQTITEAVKKFLLAASAAVSNATSDQSVSTIADDKLGFSVYAIALRDFIASKDTSTPLTISIEARWGQGKSSLMRMVQNELNPKREKVVRLKIWFRLQWWRLCWLAATPVWYAAVLVTGLAAKRKFKNKLFVDVAEGLSYVEPKAVAEKEETTGEVKHPPLKRLIAWSVKKRLPVEAQHPTIWFNAWKYDKEEEIWSALATSILDQIKHSRWWPARIGLWANLQWKRANKVKALRDVFKKIFWPVILAGLVILWTSYRETVFANINNLLNEQQRTFITWLLGSGLLVSVGVKFASILDDPFSLSLEKYVTAPDYKQKIGFIGEFEADFKRIVEIVTRPVWGWKPRKLIIFIDDLDRCEPPKSADVIEAINVFLDSVGCVFVLGMDSRAVIASIETKYDKMFQRLQQDDPTNPTLGRDFLEKIIQVPFAIPPVSDKSMEPYLIDIIGTKPLGRNTEIPQPQEVPVTEPNPFTGFAPAHVPEMPVVTPAGEAAKEDLGSYGDLEIWEAIKKGVDFLEPNPRQMKRFINLFRLQVYISRNRELFYEYGPSGEAASRTGYTPGRLAAWTAFSMRWPLIVGCLAEETQQAGLRNWLLHISKLVSEDGGWATSKTNKAALKKSFDELGDGRFQFSTPEKNGGTTARKGKAAKETEASSKNPGAGRTWRDLPWEHYLGEPDFLRAVKALESWWTPPETREEIQKQRDCLAMAMMFE